MAWYSGNHYERFMLLNRMTGPYWWSYWGLILTNVLIPQLLWFERFRTNVFVLWALSIVINVGMWLERFVIIVTSLHRDFLPSSWGMYSPTIWDWSTYIGTIGLFLTLLFLFIRFLPMIAIFEMRTMVPAARVDKGRARDRLAGLGTGIVGDGRDTGGSGSCTGTSGSAQPNPDPWIERPGVHGATRTLRPGGRVREPDGARPRGRQGARGGLSQDGRLFAHPHRGTAPRPRPEGHQAAVDRSRRRPDGRDRRVRPRVPGLRPSPTRSTSAGGRCTAGRRSSCRPSRPRFCSRPPRPCSA